ncbi:fimbrial biogenesis chaperone [Acinetobacter ihumii]|uniref:fimbrial biogenesis chaperone n=1 Tax=Acinetobacter ihumii TaxID=2483802 RepID=UPI00103212C1|nr:molecular chaperone [Acinetobacter ihumii]
MNAIFSRMSKMLMIAVSSFVVSHSFAGVVLTGTRVILADGQNEKAINLQNKDVAPALVQIWLDEGDENSTLETAQAPFVVSPQIFRMQPNAGQTVRVRFVGADQVTQDRESLYFLNFLQYPAAKKQDADQNRLMVVFKNRVKVFYRPKNLVGNSAQTLDKLNFKFDMQTKQLSVNNPTAYYASVQELRLLAPSKDVLVKQNEMIAPYSTVSWSVKSSDSIPNTAKIKITLINDYGASAIREASLSP